MRQSPPPQPGGEKPAADELPPALAAVSEAVCRERHHLLEPGAVLPQDAGLAEDPHRLEDDRIVLRLRRDPGQRNLHPNRLSVAQLGWQKPKMAQTRWQ
jgi:hypothetical protein